MYAFHPYITNDGSVGLYSPDFNDIYHSASGALTEAYEKFILPVDFDKLMQKKSIKILDICYGIGYNSKSFLNLILKNFPQKNLMQKKNIAQIYTNNHEADIQNSNKILSPNIAKIYSDNIIPRISIHAVDNDKILTFLSPFIKTGVKNKENNKIDFDYEKIYKYLDSDPKKNLPKISDEINFLILSKICEKSPEFLKNKELSKIINSTDFRPFFNQKLKGIYNYYKKSAYKSDGKEGFFAFIHNIYYRHVSNGYKRRLKAYNLLDIDFTLKNTDARDFIKFDKNLYDVIFLDAFTPSKCPCLWTYEFFKQLFDHMEDDGILLTYSTSASIRAAMTEAGFSIGYIYNENQKKCTGTIATKNYNLIKYPLSEFDLGLLNTTAGIFYRDENLTALNEAIINQRKNEILSSKRISTSSYKKTFKRRQNV